MKGNEAKIGKYSNMLLAKRKLIRMFQDSHFRNKTITQYIFAKWSLKENWVVFESFMGRNYSGQPKYIYQYMQKTYGDKYRYIWIVDKHGIKIDGKCKKVKRWSLKYFFYMNRSKYWVLNMRQPLSVPRREETILLQTWHGTPLKKLAFDLENIHSYTPKYKENVFKQSRDWNYMLSDNPHSSKCFTSAYMLEQHQLLEAGYPANDPMYAPDKEQRAEQLKEQLGIPKDKKVILYAPTWRDDEFIDTGEYGFNLALDVDKMREQFSDEYVLLMRLHYLVVERLDKKMFDDFVMNVSSYDDITDLYLLTDLIITDYSSVFFDFANLKRPMLFYMYDLENYRDNLHGFYLNIQEILPGPILRTNEEVFDAIANIDRVEEEYKEKYDAFYEEFCCWDDGHAAERVVKEVFQK
jgi:CDP-glycerol glycerophosphotransferase